MKEKEYSLKEQFQKATSRRLNKGELLVRAGDICNNFFYVEKGCLRSYIVDKKGKEHIYQFAPEDWVISDEEALLEGKPSILYIDAIEDSVVKVLIRPEGEWSANLDKETATELAKKFERKIKAFRTRIIQLLSASAEDRYSAFINTYPGLAQRVPLKMIASYLGVTPESLSRVRKDLLHKK
jgi:CRP-like cAMP-binding protein